MRAFLNWSGGKDSALCLYEARRQGLDIGTLVTTVNGTTGRITMHGVPQELLRAQADSLQLPLHTVPLPEDIGMTAYEDAISAANQKLIAEGYSTAVSGDLFLDDLRAYREHLYGRDGLQTAFPLWGRDTAHLLREFIGLGFQAIIVAVNEAFLDRSFCGRLLDASFLADLPPGVDPCGERGEYHSFVFDGPVFTRAVPFEKAGIVHRTYPAPVKDDCFGAPQPPASFYFYELLPGSGPG